MPQGSKYPMEVGDGAASSVRPVTCDRRVTTTLGGPRINSQNTAPRCPVACYTDCYRRSRGAGFGDYRVRITDFNPYGRKP